MDELEYKLLKKVSKQEINQLHKEFFQSNRMYEENAQAHMETVKQLKTEKKIDVLLNELKKNISRLEGEVFYMVKNLEKAHNEKSDIHACCNNNLQLIHQGINENKEKIKQLKNEITILRDENKEDLKIATHLEKGVDHIKDYLSQMETLLKLV